MSTPSCTLFTYYEEGHHMCRCPKCSGFLPRNFPLKKQFLCRKCGVVLETLPSLTEDPDDDGDPDYRWGGRICVVPDYAVTISTELPPRPVRHEKKKTSKWAMGVNFSRRVWKDKTGEFVEVYPERIDLEDPRILQIVEDEQSGGNGGRQ
uniref:Uncharacterized protein n=2 Tax=viral metagenome TaxID=1070528 RepID=A0A6M3M4G1_9ZZZZ